jgi:hypothetical protein
VGTAVWLHSPNVSPEAQEARHLEIALQLNLAMAFGVFFPLLFKAMGKSRTAGPLLICRTGLLKHKRAEELHL